VTALPWYVARAAGLVSWALLTASVVWGLAITTKVLGRRPKPAWLLDLHRYLGALATIFVAVHVGALLVDTYLRFDLVSVLVPFASQWRPGAVAWGVVGFYLILAVELTSLARTKLPRRLWRATHLASFPLFLVATLHAITAGTDAHRWMFEVVAIASVALVSGLTAHRVTRDVSASRTRTLAARSAMTVPGAPAVPPSYEAEDPSSGWAAHQPERDAAAAR
jgi:predicted ferric reductase